MYTPYIGTCTLCTHIHAHTHTYAYVHSCTYPHACTHVYTHTHTDLNIRPSPPANVAFEVRRQSDSGSPLISAQWDVVNCGNNFNCSEALGYVATCREEATGYELRSIVWQSQVEGVAVAVTTMVAAPYTRYSCTVAALNSYGIGYAGSIITVETPESGNFSYESYASRLILHPQFTCKLVEFRMWWLVENSFQK